MKFDTFVESFKSDLNKAIDIDSTNKVKVKYLGRNGLIKNEIQKIKNLNDKDKILFGKQINEIKNNFLYLLKKKNDDLEKKSDNSFFDITLPGSGISNGSIHIINKTIFNIDKYFSKNGFIIVNGYEIDSSAYNFNFLNMPESHPSRDVLETFYLDKNLLLRTHTSNMQVHFMKNNNPPFSVLSYGKVYRRDSDISHTPMFHQVEGFIVDKHISLSNLKYLLINFLSYFFDKNVETRIRASYFPFTEPSIEIDIKCINCLGNLCSLCKYTGWIEILGCGIIHSNVLKNCKINEKEYTGLAFGMGIERITMIKHNINDLRLFFENNIEFLNQL